MDLLPLALLEAPLGCFKDDEIIRGSGGTQESDVTPIPVKTPLDHLESGPALGKQVEGPQTTKLRVEGNFRSDSGP